MNRGEGTDSEEGPGEREFQSRALGPEGEEQRWWWYRKPEGRETFRSRHQMGRHKVGVMG